MSNSLVHMANGVFVSVIVLAAALISPCHGQSLTEQLLKEDATKLVKLAREQGDIVRGAILFHQGNINCAKCHRQQSERDRLGPDLAKLGDDVTEEQIVESILNPSAKINEDFQTVRVLKLDGEQVVGLVTSENEARVIIRQRDNIDNLVTIPRAEIDEIETSPQSVMPDKLADEMKSRRQFLDLLRYVLDVKQRGVNPLGGVGQTASRELPASLRGLAHIQQFNCVACHEPSKNAGLSNSRQAPNLTWSATWLNPSYLQAFIADPAAVKPGTHMPGVLGSLPAGEQKVAAESLAHFLLSKVENKFEAQSTSVQSAAAAGSSCSMTLAARPATPLGTNRPLSNSWRILFRWENWSRNTISRG